MKSKRKNDGPRAPLRNGSSPGGREPLATHCATDSPRQPRHRGSEVRSATDGESQFKPGFMQAIKAARRQHPGRARTKSQRRDPKRKAHSLIDKVYRWENLFTAWRRVRRNKGAHGLDRVTIHMFEADVETHLREIQRKLMERRYIPTPVRRVFIEKSSDPKKRRPLGIPVVADRIVQQAIFQIVDPLFDSEMSDRSFGFRKSRNAHQAIATLIQDAKEGFSVVVDADVRSFFDEIDHNVAMSCVRERIADGRVINLIEAFLKVGVWDHGKISVPERGTPQGGVISPWIANLVLDKLDKAIEAKGWRHVRYADDFVILCPSREEADLALKHTKEVLKKLKLELHPDKTSVTDFWSGFEFLGLRFRSYRLGIKPKSIERFKDKVRTLTRRQQGRNVDAVLEDLNPVIRGWARYVGVAEATQTLRTLDKWIRMRIRAFRLKRKCHHDNWRLPNRRLEKWGLLSLTECRPKLRLSYVRARTQ